MDVSQFSRALSEVDDFKAPDGVVVKFRHEHDMHTTLERKLVH